MIITNGNSNNSGFGYGEGFGNGFSHDTYGNLIDGISILIKDGFGAGTFVNIADDAIAYIIFYHNEENTLTMKSPNS